MATINKFLLQQLLLLVLFNYAVESLENGLARTPPMGWISWERFKCETDCKSNPHNCISTQLYKTMADRLIADQYLKVGYNYVNIDDCWSAMKRTNDTQELIADLERFPGGIKPLADYIHKQGLYLGIYGDCGTKTCAGYPGQLKSELKLEDNNFETDAKSFFQWQIDSFKFDGCHIDPAKAESICPQMSKALASTNRQILVICEWPYYMLRQSSANEPNWILAQESCNAWRYFEDVEDSWLSILSIVDFTVKLQNTIKKYHGPGHWFDPDQLVIGNFALSLEQAKAQMAIWCVWAAPLYMSNDLRQIDPEMAAVLKNEHLISVNQDPLGVFGLMVAEEGDESNRIQAFVKPIEPIKNGCPSFAIVYFNRQTLGNGKVVKFKNRDLFLNSAIYMAAARSKTIYPNDSRSFDGSNCLNRIRTGMTRENTLVINSSTSIDTTPIIYNVYDLYYESKFLGQTSLNSSLELFVKPSGVRAVKLIEADQTIPVTNIQ